METDFQIYLDRNGFIQTVSYLGRKSLPVSNLLCLFGLHEKYLNRMLSRYQEGIIPDITEYLNENWTLPVYHDRFRLYLEQSRRSFLEAALRDDRFKDTKDLLVRLRDFSSTKPLEMQVRGVCDCERSSNGLIIVLLVAALSQRYILTALGVGAKAALLRLRQDRGSKDIGLRNPGISPECDSSGMIMMMITMMMIIIIHCVVKERVLLLNSGVSEFSGRCVVKANHRAWFPVGHP